MRLLAQCYPLLFLMLFFCSCSQPKPETQVHGRIIGYGKGEFSMKLRYFDLETMEQSLIELKTNIDEDGYFDIVTDQIQDDMWEVWTTIGREVKGMSISPGDSLYIEVNAKDFDETITFSGRGAAKSNYRAWKYLKFEDRENGVSPHYQRALSFDEFKLVIEENRDDKLAKLEEAYANGIKDSFYEDEKVNIDIDYMRSFIGRRG